MLGPDPQTAGVVEGTVESAVFGGLGSVLGGGKFANGAVTSAFGYLFNKGAHLLSDQNSSNSAPTLSHPGNGAIAFVGGYFDYTTNGPVMRAYYAYISKYPGAGAVYFTWDQVGGLGSWLDSNPGATVYAHSYGGDTAAAVVGSGHQVGALYTIDPVSRIRLDFAAVRANARTWIDYYATGGRGSVPNAIAGIGGAWDNGPSGYATVVPLPYDHATIMCFVAPVGC